MEQKGLEARIKLLMLLEAERLAEKIPRGDKAHLNNRREVLIRAFEPHWPNVACEGALVGAVDELMNLASHLYSAPLRPQRSALGRNPPGVDR